ncbi:MAG: hypothetical protein QGG40_01980, partial [Myxococcota bacterium]|nr:hypothetical protein [Myxococcota bacterium]
GPADGLALHLLTLCKGGLLGFGLHLEAGNSGFRGGQLTGHVLSHAGAIAGAQGNEDLEQALELLGLGLWIAGAATNPAADVRQWDFVPESWWLVTGDWAPGRHGVRIDGRVHEIDVPERGQLFVLFPAMRPGSAPPPGQRVD